MNSWRRAATGGRPYGLACRWAGPLQADLGMHFAWSPAEASTPIAGSGAWESTEGLPGLAAASTMSSQQYSAVGRGGLCSLPAAAIHPRARAITVLVTRGQTPSCGEPAQHLSLASQIVEC